MGVIGNDYVFRVIVEGDDLLSNVFSKSAANYQRDTNKIRNSSKAIKRELDNLAISVQNFDRAISSKATTPRGFAKIFGVSEKEITQDFARKLVNIRRFIRGEISRNRQGDFTVAQFLGIDVRSLDEFENDLKKIFGLRDKFKQGIDTRNTGFALRSLFGVDPDRAKAEVRSLAKELEAVERDALRRQQEIARVFRGLGAVGVVAGGLQAINTQSGKDALFKELFPSGRKELPQFATGSTARFAAGPIGSTTGGREVFDEKTIQDASIRLREFAALAEKLGKRVSDKWNFARMTTIGQKFLFPEKDVNRLTAALTRLGNGINFVKASAKNFFSGFFDTNRLGQLRSDIAKLEKTELRLKSTQTNLFAQNRLKEANNLTQQIAGVGRELEKLRGELKQAENFFNRAGSAVRRFVNSTNTLIHVRWFLLVSLITLLAKGLITLGAALVEIGASAVQAGAALGGAFAAGAAQALSVLGLLEAAFSRIKAVFTLVQQQQKLDIRSSTDAQAQAQAEQAAQEQLTTALQNRSDAIIDLAKARKQAARDIVDASLQEKEANLSLQEATLGVYDAKKKLADLEKKNQQDKNDLRDLQDAVREAQKRLALAKSQGQEVEVTAAAHQLAIAQQNLNAFNDQTKVSAHDIKEAQVGVKRAVLDQQKARIDAKRAREDNRNAQKKGIEGDDQVVQALRRVRDASQQVVKAQEAVAEAAVKQTNAQKVLQDQLANLSGAERALFNTANNFATKYKEVFRPITDIIVRSVDRGIQKASGLLSDNQLLSAARGLATGIGASIDRISSFATSPGTRSAFAFFMREARRNLPLITTAFLNLAKAFLNIARAGAPLFRQLLEQFVGFTGRIRDITNNRQRMQDFFASAGKYLHSWIELGKAIGSVLIAVTKVAGPSGKKLIDDFTKALEGLANFLNKNQASARSFFEEQRVSIEEFAKAIFILSRSLFAAFNNSNLTQFVTVISQILIPAFQLALNIINGFAIVTLKIAKIPIANEFLKLAFAIGILHRLFPFLKNLDSLVLSIFTNKKTQKAIKNFFDRIAINTRLVTPAFEAAGKAVDALTARIVAATVAQEGFNAAVLTNPYVLLAAAIIVAIGALVALELKFHLVSRAVKSFVSFVRENWRTFIIAAFIGPIAFVIRFRNTFIKALGDIGKSFSDFVKLGQSGALQRGFREGFNAAIRAVEDFAHQIVQKFTDIKNSIASGEFISDAIKIGEEFINGIIEGIKNKIPSIRDILMGALHAVVNFVKSGLGISSPSTYTKEQLGKPMADGVTQGLIEGSRGMGEKWALTLKRELSTAQTQLRTSQKSIVNDFENFKSLIGQQIDIRFDSIVTPASREISRIQAQEDRRNRQQQISQANQSVKEAKAAVTKTGKEVEAAKKALRNADNKEERTAAKDRLTQARQAHNDALKELKAQQDAQKETLHQAAVQQRLDYLNQLDQQQRAAIEKRRSQAQAEANTLFSEYLKAINHKDFKKAQSIFNQIIKLTGKNSISELGKSAADALVEGLLTELRARQKDINKGVQAQVNEAKAKQKRAAAISDVLGAAPQKTVRALKKQGLTPEQSLDFLVQNNLLTKEGLIRFIRDFVDNDEAVDIYGKIKDKPVTINKHVSDIENSLGKKFPQADQRDLLIHMLQQKGKNGQVLTYLIQQAIKSGNYFREGGQVGGYSSDLFDGQAVPAIVHVGEWVLNKRQQQKLANRVGESVGGIRDWLFGPKDAGDATRAKAKAAWYRKNYNYNGQYYDLVGKTDDYNQEVWFVEFDDGTYGQISGKSAARIRKSHGHWFPRGVLRDIHGFTAKGQAKRAAIEGRLRDTVFRDTSHGMGYALGGVVRAGGAQFLKANIPRFAEGGVVTAAPIGVASGDAVSKTVNQNFTVHTEGESDWNYIMRLGAIHALG